MRHSTLLAVVLSFLSTVILRGDDELFSEVAMESVFVESAKVESAIASKNATGEIARITGVSTLIDALTAAGLDASKVKGRADLELNHAGWQFPVSIGVQVDQDRIDCEMSLVKIDNSDEVNAQTLLSLLASGNRRGTSFAYDPETKVIQVRNSLPNRSIRAEQLKADLIQMAIFAEQHSEIWLKLGDQKNDESPAEKPKPTPSLVGQWTASLASGEAFAIAISSGSEFQLVHLKSGKSTVSKGNSILSGNQLTLAGENDVTLKGSVTQTSPDTFSLAISDANGNPTATLEFKKAK